MNVIKLHQLLITQALTLISNWKEATVDVFDGFDSGCLSVTVTFKFYSIYGIENDTYYNPEVDDSG